MHQQNRNSPDLLQQVQQGLHPDRHAPTHPYLEDEEARRRQKKKKEQAQDL